MGLFGPKLPTIEKIDATQELMAQANKAYVTGDFDQAARLFLQAGKKGNPQGWYRLGLMAKKGPGDISIEKAAAYFLNAADGQHALALTAAAQEYKYNEKKANKYLQQAQQAQKDADSPVNLAIRYDIGMLLALGDEADKNGDLEAGARAFQCVTLMGDSRGEYYLADMYLHNHHIVEGCALYEKFAWNWDREAQYLLGKMYFDGAVAEKGTWIWFPEKFETARKWLNRSRDPLPKSLQLLEVIDRVEPLAARAQKCLDNKNAQGARVLYEQAAALGWTPALRKLGILYRNGGRDLPKDPARAYSYFEQAMQKGNLDAIFYCARMYQKGEGVPQNTEKALELYKISATVGERVAMNNLGCIYRDGKLVPQDYEQAIHWLGMAAEYRHASAALDMAQLHAEGHKTPRDADYYNVIAGAQGSVKGQLAHADYLLRDYITNHSYTEKSFGASFDARMRALDKKNAVQEACLDAFNLAMRENSKTDPELLLKLHKTLRGMYLYSKSSLEDLQSRALLRKAALTGYQPAVEAYERYVGHTLQQEQEESEKRAAENYAEAVRLLNGGDCTAFHRSQAMTLLGVSIHNNADAMQLWKEIARQEQELADLAEAAVRGDGMAALRYAQLMDAGCLAQSRDADTALEFYRIARDHKIVEAATPLLRLVMSGMEASYGIKLLKEQKYQEALSHLEEAAPGGDPLVQYLVGALYFNGEEVEKDLTKARTWLEASLRQGVLYGLHACIRLCEDTGDTDAVKHWCDLGEAYGDQYSRYTIALNLYEGKWEDSDHARRKGAEMLEDLYKELHPEKYRDDDD